MLPLRAALKRGALVTAANWPVIFVQLTTTSMFRLALAVPIVGGVFMVAVLAHADVQPLFADGVQGAAGLVVASLLHRPIALVSFVLAVGVVAAGGGLVSCLASAGSMGILAEGERRSETLHQPPFRLEKVREASAFSITAFLESVRQFGGRFVLIGLWTSIGYAGIVGLGLAALVTGSGLAARYYVPWVMPATVFAVVVCGGVLVAVVQLLQTLVQVVVATSNSRLGPAVRALMTYLYDDARQVVGVFAVVVGLTLLAAAASVLATAGLALVAWVPLVGLAVVPLQLAAWLVRSVVFHFLDGVAWAAYLSHYRRYAEPEQVERVLQPVRMYR